jgi:predicted Zn-dependent protease
VLAGRLAEIQQRHADAIAAFREAWTAAPGDSELKLLYGRALLRGDGQEELAWQLLGQASREIDSPGAWIAYGDACQKRGEPEAARSAWRHARELGATEAQLGAR